MKVSSQLHASAALTLLRTEYKAAWALCRREVECVWNLMSHGDAREGKWRGDWRMEWVASTLTLHRNVVYPALLPLMRTPRLPAVDWTDAPADLIGLVRFGERRSLVSARVPSHFKRSLPLASVRHQTTNFRWSSPQPSHYIDWGIPSISG
jgi:hypothetical protein